MYTTQYEDWLRELVARTGKTAPELMAPPATTSPWDAYCSGLSVDDAVKHYTGSYYASQPSERSMLAGVLLHLLRTGVTIGTQDIAPSVIQIHVDAAPDVQYNNNIA